MPVVLLHSGITDARQWTRELAEWPLDAGAPDLHAGFELTEPSALVGNSFGGRIAMELAVLHPELVERLVLVCPGLPGVRSPDLDAIDAREEELVEAGEFQAAAELMVETWVPGAPEHVRAYVCEAQTAAYRLPPPTWLPRLDPPLAERLAEVRAPTLLVDGGLDRPEFRVIADRLERELPDVRGRVTIPGAYHLPNLERPDAFDAAVLPFLSA
ncbi:MAG: alpha/beta fold hydrolase [Gaiellaceae bacterium]